MGRGLERSGQWERYIKPVWNKKQKLQVWRRGEEWGMVHGVLIRVTHVPSHAEHASSRHGCCHMAACVALSPTVLSCFLESNPRRPPTKPFWHPLACVFVTSLATGRTSTHFINHVCVHVNLLAKWENGPDAKEQRWKSFALICINFS